MERSYCEFCDVSWMCETLGTGLQERMAPQTRVDTPVVGFGDDGGGSAVRGQAKDTGTLVEGMGRDVLVLVRWQGHWVHQSQKPGTLVVAMTYI